MCVTLTLSQVNLAIVARANPIKKDRQTLHYTNNSLLNAFFILLCCLDLERPKKTATCVPSTFGET